MRGHYRGYAEGKTEEMGLQAFPEISQWRRSRDVLPTSEAAFHSQKAATGKARLPTVESYRVGQQAETTKHGNYHRHHRRHQSFCFRNSGITHSRNDVRTTPTRIYMNIHAHTYTQKCNIKLVMWNYRRRREGLGPTSALMYIFIRHKVSGITN